MRCLYCMLVSIFIFASIPQANAQNKESDAFSQAVDRYNSDDYKSAFGIFKPLCDDKADAESCYYKGLILSNEKSGIPFDYKKAEEYFNMSCNTDLILGCDEITQLYRGGKLTDKDNLAQAAELQKLCDKKDSAACYELADMYAGSSNIKLDLDKAYSLYNRSCLTFGDPEGCNRLARFMLDHASSDEKSPVKINDKKTCETIMSALNQSCETGSAASGCEAMGDLYNSKVNKNISCAEPDNVKGIDYYIKSCKIRFEANGACSKLREIIIMNDGYGGM